MKLKLSFLWIILSVSPLSFGKLAPLAGFDLGTEKSSVVSPEGKKALVVAFLSATCPCSNSHVEELRSLSEKYRDFQFVGIHSNANESRELSIAYFKKIQFPFPVIQDEKFQYADQLKANKTPHAFILDVEGQVLFQGGVTDSNKIESSSRKYLREALEDLQNGRQVKTASVRTLGCVIDRGVKNVW